MKFFIEVEDEKGDNRVFLVERRDQIFIVADRPKQTHEGKTEQPPCSDTFDSDPA